MGNWAGWEECDLYHLHRYGKSFCCGAVVPDEAKLIWQKSPKEVIPYCPECLLNTHKVQKPPPAPKPKKRTGNLKGKELVRHTIARQAALRAGLPTPEYVRQHYIKAEKCPYCPRKIMYIKNGSKYTAHDAFRGKAIGIHYCNGSGAENDAPVGISGGGFETNRRKH